MPKSSRGRARQPHSTTTGDLAPPPPNGASGSFATGSTRFSTAAFRRPTYPEAVARYEAGMRLLQEHRFLEAVAAFRSVLMQYPEERELNERVRVYLAACERQLRAHSEP